MYIDEHQRRHQRLAEIDGICLSWRVALFVMLQNNKNKSEFDRITMDGRISRTSTGCLVMNALVNALYKRMTFVYNNGTLSFDRCHNRQTCKRRTMTCSSGSCERQSCNASCWRGGGGAEAKPRQTGICGIRWNRQTRIRILVCDIIRNQASDTTC
jgi:hypothetical protein